jgi:5'-3' exonuclease
MKVHLFDGTFELFRAYYGAPAATTKAGEEVGATRSLLLSLATFARQDGVSHLACAFDHVIESFRNDLFEGYKTGDGIAPELWAQFPLAEVACRALGVVTWPMVEFEADDALATAASRFSETDAVEQVVIVSPDKDLMQCVRGDLVVVYDRMRKRVYNEALVLEKFGVQPRSIPDYLALVGDSADGIPGVPRWGAKSAAAVLAHYGHLQNIPDNERTWPIKVRGAPALAASLRALREESLLYRKLAVLRTDVPLSESLEDLRWRGPVASELAALCERIEDDSALKRLGLA